MQARHGFAEYLRTRIFTIGEAENVMCCECFTKTSLTVSTVNRSESSIPLTGLHSW